ncbi:MAG: UDP-N-acetylmuramate dehydrogenase [Ardenticatenales bacterium]|nr:UDP-N-acetylmuramate dehydrogenase [Ardenticatenales bacterium]
MKPSAPLKKDTVVRLLLAGEMGPGKVLQDEPMAKHTSFRVGGTADWMLRAEDADSLIKAVYVARRTNLPYRIIGAGSNILVSDKGIRGVVVWNKADHYELIEHARGFVLLAETGVMLPKLAGELAKKGAAGMEWGVGIPGTIGGAVVQNAGAWGQEMKDRLLSMEYIMPANDIVKTAPASMLGLRYRGSNILDVQPEQRPIIVRAWIRLDREEPEVVVARTAEYVAERTASQPRSPSGGSTFRNPPDDYAGRLLEEAGLKGHRIGNAHFSEKHANFIVNDGNASAWDIQELMDLGQATVLEKFGIHLEPEIELVGDWEPDQPEDEGNDSDEGSSNA